MRISDWSSDVCSSDLTVNCCSHAELAIRSTKVDLVVTDIRLTGTRSGIDVAQMAHDRGMAVLFATAFCPAEARHLAIGCLAKPFAQRDLLTAIEVADAIRSEEHTSELQSLMRISYAVFCLHKKTPQHKTLHYHPVP